jgi:lipopolysaccharide/colanic/teichoic acid biosynthesis glycosyltransferase
MSMDGRIKKTGLWSYQWLKRAIDILLSVFLILFLLPVFALISVLILVFMGPPVLFRQERIGQDLSVFVITKYRTMRDEKDSQGQVLPDEERLTRFGRFLRSTSLDELPSLVNVLRGQMSIVGPRPLLKEYLDSYTPEQIRRHEVKPGMTGWAQIHGRNAISWQEKFELDVWYIENMNFRLDMQIMLRTIIMILKREGISQPGRATVEPFSESSR